MLLSTKNLRLQVPKKKLAARFMGPYKVIDAIGSQAYRLALPAKIKIHNVFHVLLLEPWEGSHHEVDKDAGSMPLADEEQEYEVKAILDSRKRKGKHHYLIKWKGWPDEYNS